MNELKNPSINSAIPTNTFHSICPRLFIIVGDIIHNNLNLLLAFRVLEFDSPFSLINGQKFTPHANEAFIKEAHLVRHESI